ncbi:MAG: hypothetical protein ACOX6D_01365 [Thermoguttaceae bacterium]
MSGPFGIMPEIFDQVKNEEGNIPIDKAVSLLSADFEKKLDEADADKDGVLSRDELRSIRPFGRPGFDRPSNPERGDFPMRDPLAFARTEDGLIDLSKLPKRMREETRNAFFGADVDKDGFLSEEEFRSLPFMNRRSDGSGPKNDLNLNRDQERRPRRTPGQNEPSRRPTGVTGIPQGIGPIGGLFHSVEEIKKEDGSIEITELNKVVCEARVKFFESVDTNGDGLLSEEELKRTLPPGPRFNGRRGPGWNRR